MDQETKRVKTILVTNVKKYRDKAGLTQEQAAEKAGITVKYWQRLEMASQKDFPSFPMLSRIAETLNTDMNNLLQE